MMNRQASLLVLLAGLLSLPVSCDGFVFGQQNNNHNSLTICKSTPDNNDNNNDDTENNNPKMKTFNPLRLMVLKAGFTEPMYSSPLNYEKRDGSYACAYCGHTLFDVNSKYDSGSGWPSFWRSNQEGAISYKREFDGRLECRCGNCQSHLGHVFPDGPKFAEKEEELVESMPESDPRAKQRLPRFCVNGASLKFNVKE